jgi:hypothetical protein
MIALRGPAKGDPPAVERILTAPTCAIGGPVCGQIPAGGTVTAYDAATLSADGTSLATVETDLTIPSHSQRVAVYDVVNQQLLKTIPAAGNPTWSDDGLLAFSTPSGLGVFHPGSGQIQTISAPAIGPPHWSLAHELLATGPSGQPLELADLDAGAIDPVPQTQGATGFIVNSGTVVFTRDKSPALYVIDLSTGSAVRTLTAAATAIGFVSGNDMVGASDSHLVRIALGDGSTQTISGGPPAADFASVEVLEGGKQLGWVARQGDADQVNVCNADGSGVTTITNFSTGTTVVGLSFSG